MEKWDFFIQDSLEWIICKELRKLVVVCKASLGIQMIWVLGGNQKAGLGAGKTDGGAALTIIGLEAQPAHFIRPFCHLVSDKVEVLLDLEERQMKEAG